ncbi:hypothetical protein [Nostocoides australiense]
MTTFMIGYDLNTEGQDYSSLIEGDQRDREWLLAPPRQHLDHQERPHGSSGS